LVKSSSIFTLTENPSIWEDFLDESPLEGMGFEPSLSTPACPEHFAVHPDGVECNVLGFTSTNPLTGGLFFYIKTHLKIQE